MRDEDCLQLAIDSNNALRFIRSMRKLGHRISMNVRVIIPSDKKELWDVIQQDVIDCNNIVVVSISTDPLVTSPTFIFVE